MNKTTIPLAAPTITEEMINAAADALRNEFLVMGESVHRFEEEFAAYCGVKEAVSVNSGTIALQIALGAVGIGPGDEVLTTPMSFIATANAIHHTGAKPTFQDIDPGTKLLDATRLNSNPKALVPVHLYGTPSPIDAYREAYPDAVIIEDACQAHGAAYRGQRAGSIGDIACFSFYTTKNMTVGGDGGMITTNDEELASMMRSVRDCGRDTKYLHGRFGHTARLNTTNAAFGRVQLRHLDAWNQRRRAIAEAYDQAFRELDWVERPEVPAAAESVHHLYAVGVMDTSRFQSALSDAGVQSGNHYPVPIHLQPPYRAMYGHKPNAYPNAESWAKRTVSLPIYPTMTDDDVARVIAAVEGHRPAIREVAS